MGKNFEQTLHESKYTNSQFIQEKMLKSFTREKQVKITIRYDCTLTRMVKILKLYQSVGKDVAQMELLNTTHGDKHL